MEEEKYQSDLLFLECGALLYEAKNILKEVNYEDVKKQEFVNTIYHRIRQIGFDIIHWGQNEADKNKTEN